MIIKNPTDNEIKVTYKGTKFSCEANGITYVKSVIATFWKEIHGFIIVQEGPEVDPRNETIEETEEEAKNESEKKSEKKEGKEELDLESLSREELDAVAVELGLDPSEYKNKPEIITAINSQE